MVRKQAHRLNQVDGNIQNVLFCCGRKCLRTSLDNARHASTLDSHSCTGPEVSPSLCCFLGTSRYKFLEYYSGNVFLKTALYICGNRKERSFCFFVLSLFPQDVPPQNMLCLHVFTCFSSSPIVQAVPLTWSDAVHVWQPSKNFSQRKHSVCHVQ